MKVSGCFRLGLRPAEDGGLCTSTCPDDAFGRPLVVRGKSRHSLYRNMCLDLPPTRWRRMPLPSTPWVRSSLDRPVLCENKDAFHQSICSDIISDGASRVSTIGRRLDVWLSAAVVRMSQLDSKIHWLSTAFSPQAVTRSCANTSHRQQRVLSLTGQVTILLTASIVFDRRIRRGQCNTRRQSAPCCCCWFCCWRECFLLVSSYGLSWRKRTGAQVVTDYGRRRKRNNDTDWNPFSSRVTRSCHETAR